ncbi:MAG: acireductone synthase [Mariniblastus sp.]|nr:acireductone synthase [Mariniblastus sp.]
MASFQCDSVLLDIEGTTSSISFVYDVMFPYVREHVDSFLAKNWSEPAFQECLPLLSSDLGQPSVERWLVGEPAQQQEAVHRAVIDLMDADVKATGLKKIQGLVWKDGFESGEIVSHLFDDVAPAMRQWHENGIEIRIYSSGSVGAQLLFFGNTREGDLLPLICGHYDTQVGGKREASSYQEIASDAHVSPGSVLFVSDVTAELEAAKAAGMQTCLSLRPGNEPVHTDVFESIRSFSELVLSRPGL